MSTEEPLELEVTFKRNNPALKKCQFGIIAKNASENAVWACYTPLEQIPEAGNNFKAHITISNHNTSKGIYSLILNISLNNYASKIRDYDIVYNVLSFEVNHIDRQHTLPFAIWPLNCNCTILTSKADIISVNAT